MNPATLPTEPKDACYLRVSTSHQNLGLEAQEARVVAYCQRNGWDIPDSHNLKEEDVCADTPVESRPQGSRLVALIRTGRVRRLAVANIERLSRDTLNGLLFERELQRGDGVEMHVVDMGGQAVLNTRSRVGRMLFIILLDMAEFELGNIRDRTAHTAGRLRETGRVSGEIPYGWKAVDAEGNPVERLTLTTTRPDGTELVARPWPDGTLLVLDEHEARIVRAMAAQQAEGWTFNRIAQDLNNRLVTAKNGGLWQTGNVQSVLQSKHTAKLLALA